MPIKGVSINDLFGRFFVRKPDGRKWDSYYRTLKALVPLFAHEEFAKTMNGFYLNVCGDFDSVRISYFVDETNSEKAISLFKRFFKNNGMVEIKDSVQPREITLAKHYGGEEYEERFRGFLVLQALIGLDLINGDLLHARILFATYRWQVRKASLPIRIHFEPTFTRYSPTYNSLSENRKEQFFRDLNEWPNPPQVDWAHMMVNMVLGCDWNFVFSHPSYLTPGKPLSIREINRYVKDLGFQIPLDWKPN